MRIVAGRWRGRQIKAPTDDRVRPTSDRVREAWMSIVNSALPDARVLDLFAGSGALGLEALSRGARWADFVETAPHALRVLRDNACSRINVDDVVREVPLSRSALERRFRKVVGRSINGELLRLRINRAIELLTETAVELKVVAQRAGFGSQSYMNAVFQGKVGKTPGSFRRMSPAQVPEEAPTPTRRRKTRASV